MSVNITDSPRVRSQKSLTALEALRARGQIGEVVCSGPWFDFCFTHVADGAVAPARAAKDLARLELYPPGGTARDGEHRTLMRRCASCGQRWYPPQYVSPHAVCEDCQIEKQEVRGPLTDHRTHISSTESPTAIALMAMQQRGVRLVQRRLLEDDEGALKRQIARYLKAAGGKAKSIRA